MTIKVIKKLLEKRLIESFPTLKVSVPNVAFQPPADGSKYLRCTLNIRTPDDSCIGGTYYRENATFNVYVLDKLNIGSGGALDTAEAIRNLFDKRTTLEEGNVRVQVLQTPHIAGEVITNDRLVIPIAIRLTAEIF